MRPPDRTHGIFMTGALLLSIVRNLTAAGSIRSGQALPGLSIRWCKLLASDVLMLRLTEVMVGSLSHTDLQQSGRSVRQLAGSSFRRHWKFRMRRAWAAKHGHDGADAAGPYGSTARIVPQHRSQAWAWLVEFCNFAVSTIRHAMHVLQRHVDRCVSNIVGLAASSGAFHPGRCACAGAAAAGGPQAARRGALSEASRSGGRGNDALRPG